MALPKIEFPVSEFTIPSTDKVVRFRPFLVKEEKILLMAQSAKSKKETLKAVKQVINNCAVDGLDVDSLQIVDIEYLFLQLRGISVNNVISLEYIDNEDGKEYKFKIDIADIKITKPKKKVSNKIMINDTVGIMVKHGDGSTIDQLEDFADEVDLLTFYVKNCITEIFDGETVYDIKEQSDKELSEFIDTLPSKTLEKIKTFFANAPKMEHVINYKNSKGTERQIVLSSLDDFFTLG
jgi:hypothetical protein